MDDRLVVIHQPDFLPYLGFFDRLLKADVFVVLDNVQFVRGTSRSWMNRDMIKTVNGAKWLTVGIQKAPMGTCINKILLTNTNGWRENNLNLLHENYRKASFYDEVMPYVEKLYNSICDKMVDFNLLSIKMLMKLLDINIEMKLASDMEVTGKNNTLVIDIVKKLGCHRYLSGVGAKDYFEPSLYEEAGIEVVWQDFKHPVYEQRFGEFIPYLSTIDMLFNCGIERSRKILRC